MSLNKLIQLMPSVPLWGFWNGEFLFICIELFFADSWSSQLLEREVSTGLTLYFANAVKSQAMHIAFGNLPSIQFLDQSIMMLGAVGHNSCTEVEACRHVIL